jgi:hypothetical protein
MNRDPSAIPVPGPFPIPVRRRDPGEVRERLRSGPLPPDLADVIAADLTPEGSPASDALQALSSPAELARWAEVHHGDHPEWIEELRRLLPQAASYQVVTVRLNDLPRPDREHLERLLSGLVSVPVLADVQAEAAKAHAKHGDNSMHGERYSSVQRLSILAEEGCQEVSEAAVAWALDLLIRNSLLNASVGRLAHELNEDIQADGSHGPGVGEGRPEHLYTELIQTAAMACSWAQRLHELMASRPASEESGT